MLQLISFIIFIVSAVVVAIMLYRKIPVLVSLPENGPHGIKKHRVILAAEKKLKDLHFDFFHKQVWLHKLLSKSRVWVLKLERKISDRLHGIRKKAQELEKK